MKAPLIELKAVDRRHDSGVLALEGLNLRVAPNESVALLGPAACGKSSALRLLAGIDRPLNGSVLRGGEPVRAPLADVAFVFSSAALMPWASVAVNVELPLRLLGTAAPIETRDARAREALALVGLAAQADALPKELDETQKMAAALARGLVTQPALLLLDDWLSQVGEAARPALRALLAQVRGLAGAPAVVLATRDVDEALLQADRVLVLGARPGRVVEELRIDGAAQRDASYLSSAAGKKARQRLVDALAASAAELAA